MPYATLRSTSSISAAGASSVCTTKRRSTFGPKVVLKATSAASRPRAMADAGNVVAGIERIPAAAEIDLEPGAEIHRIRLRRNADVAQITGAIARRDVHAATQRD